MQRSEFASEKYPLGTARLYIVSPKAKGKTSAFCTSGCGWVSILDSGICPICKGQILKKIRYAEYSRSFQNILQKFGTEFGILSISARAELALPVQIAGGTYFVPIQMFLEFEKISHGNEGRHKMFFQNIMNTCKTVK